MPATRGKLRKVRLNGQPDTGPSTFKLDHGLSHYPAHPAAKDKAEEKKLHSQGFSRDQLEMMGKIVQHYDTGFELQALMGKPDFIDDEFSIVGAEFLFHGTETDWDTIYDSGGLKSQGTNPSMGLHVLSSSANATGYVSGTRVLSVAKSFAKSTGWVYLIYAPQGVAVHSTSPHKQAEVAAIDSVPIKDIFMFKLLTDPNLIYINEDFRSALKSNSNLDRCLRLLGGGTYPQGLFWSDVP